MSFFTKNESPYNPSNDFPKGGHGPGLAAENPEASIWPEMAEKWLKRRFRSQEQ